MQTQPSLPFSGRTPISRHRSAQAGMAVAAGRVTKSLRYLALLREAGPRGLSDHETHKMTGWPMSSVTSIRNGCGGLVVPGERVGLSPFGHKVTTWVRTNNSRW